MYLLTIQIQKSYRVNCAISFKKKYEMDIVPFLFIFDKYYLIID